MFTKMAKFITCNFCTGLLFMASLAAVHNFGICAFPILGPVQLNIHCLFLSRVLQVPRKKLNLVLQCHELKLQELKTVLPGSSNYIFSFHTFSFFVCREERNRPSTEVLFAVILSCYHSYVERRIQIHVQI